MRAALVAFCGLLAAASASERATLYSRSIVPEGWTVGDRASASAPLKFTVAMKYVLVSPSRPLPPPPPPPCPARRLMIVLCRQQNLDKLDAKFWDVSDPNR